MRGARLAGARLLLGVLTGSPLAVTAAHAAEVEARGPAECPDAAELGFRVERNVGVPLARAPAIQFVVETEKKRAGAYVARLKATSAGGTQDRERALTGADCSELADAIVVAITLALGAAASPPEPAAAAPPDAAPDAKATGLPAAPVSNAGADAATEREAPPDADPASRWRPALSLASLLDAGSLPDPGLGAALGLELSWRRLQLRALTTLLFEQHTELGGEPGSTPGADLQLLAGSLSGCTTSLGGGGGRGQLAAALCLGLELGRLSGTGTGVASPRSGSALWAAPRADVGGSWRLGGGPVYLTATLTAATPLARNRFALREIGTVYRPPPVIGRLSLGVVVGFE